MLVYGIVYMYYDALEMNWNWRGLNWAIGLINGVIEVILGVVMWTGSSGYVYICIVAVYVHI